MLLILSRYSSIAKFIKTGKEETRINSAVLVAWVGGASTTMGREDGETERVSHSTMSLPPRGTRSGRRLRGRLPPWLESPSPPPPPSPIDLTSAICTEPDGSRYVSLSKLMELLATEGPEEEREIKYVVGKNSLGKPKLTILAPKLKYLPMPQSSWPTFTHFMEHWLEEGGLGSTVDVFSIIDGREETHPFTTAEDRSQFVRLLEREADRKMAQGELYNFTVSALQSRFMSRWQ